MPPLAQDPSQLCRARLKSKRSTGTLSRQMLVVSRREQFRSQVLFWLFLPLSHYEVFHAVLLVFGRLVAGETPVPCRCCWPCRLGRAANVHDIEFVTGSFFLGLEVIGSSSSETKRLVDKDWGLVLGKDVLPLFVPESSELTLWGRGRILIAWRSRCPDSKQCEETAKSEDPFDCGRSLAGAGWRAR